MTTQVQFRRGTTTQHNSFTGAVGEVTVDTDLDTLRVHDGAVAGGVRIAKFTDIAAQTIDISDSSSNTISLVPGSTDVTFIGDDITIAAAGNTMTFTLNNTITVDQISSGNSTGITLNDDLLLAGTLRAEDSGAISVDGAMQISGVVTGLTIEATGDTAANDNAAMGYTAAEGLILTGQGSTNDVTIKNDADADVIEIPTGTTNVTIAGTLGTGGAITATGSFIIGSADLNEADLEKLDGITNGTVAAAKAVVVDGNLDASGFRNVTATGSFIIGSADMNETDLEKLDGITNGTAAANKALVIDGSKDIGTLGAVTATTFVIGSADINETDLEKIDGITNGTVAANKAVVADANKDVTTFRNCTATTFIGALTGNADTATVLATTRAIGGVNFNGSAAINLPGVNTAGNQDTSGTAAIGTAVTVTANDTANETCFITFVDGATGTQGIETDTGLNYNPSTNVLATTATAAQYSDVAEKYIGDAQYESGTVVIFGGDHEVTTTELTHDPRVAGVVSTAPAYLMNSHLEATYVIDLALTGRVPCKVKGVVAKGDLIVSSQTAGVGMKLQQESYNVGCVIGKALEDKDTADVGVIEVVVGRL